MLKHPVIPLDDAARPAVGEAFAEVIKEEKLTCWACAVMPDHVHILVRKHRLTFEEMMEHLKDASATRLRAAGRFPDDHPVWTAHGGWSVFLDHPDEDRRTVTYIERNPDSYHLPRQTWPFVQTYDGWPLHVGHSPNSPYVKALRAVGRYP